MPTQQLWVGGIFEAAIKPRSRFERDFVGAADYGGEINFHVRDSEAEVVGSPGQMRHAGRGDGGFGGRAAEVDARAAQILALSQRHCFAGLG